MSKDFVPWYPDPASRGTLNILISCASTLWLCIWSALHTDIQKGRSAWVRGLSKTGWFIIGLLCPELLLFNAWHQLREAIRLTQYARKRLRVRAGNEDAPPSEPARLLMRVLEWLIGEVSISSPAIGPANQSANADP